MPLDDWVQFAPVHNERGLTADALLAALEAPVAPVASGDDDTELAQ